MLCPRYIGPGWAQDMPQLRDEEEKIYFRRLLALGHQFIDGIRINTVDLCCWNSLFDRFYIVEDAKKW